MEKQQNIIFIDYLTFTTRDEDPYEMISFLGLPIYTGDSPYHANVADVHHKVMWEDRGGINFYPARKYFDGISICYGREGMGVCVEMSGQGCRSFESYGHGQWDQILKVILSDPDCYHITRLDIAYDDHTGLLDLDLLHEKVRDKEYTCTASKWKVEYGSSGTTLYFGSPASETRCRIYDKAAERGFDDRHWIRVELQLRRDRATSAALSYIDQEVTLGQVFAGILSNFLLFRCFSETDSNKSRWDIFEPWQKLIDEACLILAIDKPGVEYNIHKVRDLCFRMWAAAIYTLLRVDGDNVFKTRFAESPPKLAPKYKKLIGDGA